MALWKRQHSNHTNWFRETPKITNDSKNPPTQHKKIAHYPHRATILDESSQSKIREENADRARVIWWNWARDVKTDTKLAGISAASPYWGLIPRPDADGALTRPRGAPDDVCAPNLAGDYRQSRFSERTCARRRCGHVSRVSFAVLIRCFRVDFQFLIKTVFVSV